MKKSIINMFIVLLPLLFAVPNYKVEALVFNKYPVCKLETKIIKMNNSEETFDFTIRVFRAEKEAFSFEINNDTTPATEKDPCVQTFPVTVALQIKGVKNDYYTDPLYEPHVGQIIQTYAQKIEGPAVFLDFKNDKYGIELLKDYGNLPSDNPIIKIVNFFKDLLARFNLYL